MGDDDGVCFHLRKVFGSAGNTFYIFYARRRGDFVRGTTVVSAETYAIQQPESIREKHFAVLVDTK